MPQEVRVLITGITGFLGSRIALTIKNTMPNVKIIGTTTTLSNKEKI